MCRFVNNRNNEELFQWEFFGAIVYSNSEQIVCDSFSSSSSSYSAIFLLLLLLLFSVVGCLVRSAIFFVRMLSLKCIFAYKARLGVDSSALLKWWSVNFYFCFGRCNRQNRTYIWRYYVLYCDAYKFSFPLFFQFLFFSYYLLFLYFIFCLVGKTTTQRHIHIDTVQYISAGARCERMKQATRITK